MSRESKFIPMPEAQTRRLRTKVKLPFAIEESIGINVKHTQALCQVSGLRHLTIKNQENPEVSNTINVVVGINEQGVGLAGKGIIKKVPTFEHEAQRSTSENFFYKNAIWQDLTISLNTKEVKQRILGSEEDVRNVAKWATELNDALTKGIVRTGLKQLLINLRKFDLIMPSVVHLTTLSVLLRGDIGNFLYWFIQDAGLWSFLGTMASSFENFKEGEGHRLSMFVNFELDRALALLVMAGGLQPLAKKINQEENDWSIAST